MSAAVIIGRCLFCQLQVNPTPAIHDGGFEFLK